MEHVPVRLGLLGGGRHALHIAEWCRRISGLTLVRCWDPEPPRRNSLAEAFGIPSTDTLDELLADESIRGVVIALPTRFHTDHIMSAARAGRHVYVTRPLAQFLPAARLAIGAAQDAGIILQTGHYERKRPSYRQIKAILETEMIGRPVGLDLSWSLPYTDVMPPEEPQTRFGRSGWTRQDLLIRGTPAFDLASYLVGPIREVTAQTSRTPELAGRMALVTLDFDSGCLGHVSASVGPAADERVTVIGTAGSVSWNGSQLTLVSLKSNRGIRPPESEVRTPPTGTPELDDLCEFVECVATGVRPEVDGEAGLAALRVAWAAIASAQHRRPVAMDEELVEEFVGRESHTETPRPPRR